MPGRASCRRHRRTHRECVPGRAARRRTHPPGLAAIKRHAVKTSHLFADLPTTMVDTAFLDRLHFYLPGWEIPKMEQRFFTSHYGLVSDYLSEALRELRKHSYADAITHEFTFGPHLNTRDEKAVRKTLSGLLKLLHPDERWTRADLREYLELAMEGRLRVKEQLKEGYSGRPVKMQAGDC